MKYSIEQLHSLKPYTRRVGRSVDAVFDVVGKVLVSENLRIPFVIENSEWCHHLRDIFIDVVIEHFGETPVKNERFVWSIQGYTSKIHLIPLAIWDNGGDRGWDIEPTYDLRFIYELPKFIKSGKSVSFTNDDFSSFIFR